MKLTKQQLKRIIKEEKAKILKEALEQVDYDNPNQSWGANDQENLEQYQASWNAGQPFGPGEEDLIMSILQYYFGAAAKDLEEAGVFFKDAGQMIRYIKMAANEYQG